MNIVHVIKKMIIRKKNVNESKKPVSIAAAAVTAAVAAFINHIVFVALYMLI